MFDINFYKDVKTFGPDYDKDTAIRSSMREFEFIFNDLEHINGNILEFGVFKGRSLKKIVELVSNRKIFGFDSFIGLPEPWKINEEKNDIYKTGHFNVNNIVPDIKNVTFYKGFFKDTIPNYINDYKENICFLHIDVDLYSSAKEILCNLNSYIKPGTIIRFDELTDWRLVTENNLHTEKNNRFYTDWEQGEWKALVEWLKEFDREVVPVSRNFTFSSTIKVIK